MGFSEFANKRLKGKTCLLLDSNLIGEDSKSRIESGNQSILKQGIYGQSQSCTGNCFEIKNHLCTYNILKQFLHGKLRKKETLTVTKVELIIFLQNQYILFRNNPIHSQGTSYVQPNHKPQRIYLTYKEFQFKKILQFPC